MLTLFNNISTTLFSNISSNFIIPFLFFSAKKYQSFFTAFQWNKDTFFKSKNSVKTRMNGTENYFYNIGILDTIIQKYFY